MPPLQPNYQLKYPALVRELHDALRTLQFPQLPECPGRIDLLSKLLGTGISEAMFLLAALHRSLPVEGDVCEFGVAQGATSALLASEIRNSGKRLWLYDSFQGLPKPALQDVLKDDIFGLGSIDRYEGQMKCQRDEVEERLREIGFSPERYRVKEGFVEASLATGENPRAVCFAYLDFDFYEPIRAGLEYLREHMPAGGRIVVDDYNFFSLGAKSAVDEFLARQSKEFTATFPPSFAGHFCVLTRKERAWWKF